MRRLVPLLFFAGCAPLPQPQPQPKLEPLAKADAGPPAPKCPDAVDVPALLAKHARAYGTAEQALASMPVTMTGTIERPGLSGRFEIVRGPKARRATMWAAGLFRASGVDAAGSWLEGTHGAVVRLQPGEAREHNLWMDQRKYLGPWDPKRGQALCDVLEGRALVRVQYNNPDEGDPFVIVDHDTGELVASGMRDTDGSQSLWRYSKWSPPDAHGVRWATEAEEMSEGGGEAKLVVEKIAPGLACAPLDASAPKAPDCLSAFAPRVAHEWAGGSKRARVPMKDDLDVVTFTAKVGSKDVTTLLDPLEGLLGVVDDPQGAKGAFVSTQHMSFDKVAVDIGTLDVGLGALTVKHAPALMRAIGPMDTTGTERPLLVSGAGLSNGLAMRVDHAKKEIVFAPSGEPLASKGAAAVPLRQVGELLVVDAKVDGEPAPMALHFQGALGAELHETWGSAHGVPGTHPTITLDKSTIIMRTPKIELGPIRYENQLAQVAVREATHALAGRLSVSVLLRCSAFVMDPGARKLWLEPPCDRPVVEDMSGWTLVRDVTSTEPPADRPWKIGGLLKDGSADRAGLKEGDRVLEVGGKPATADRGAFLPLLGQKPGTKVDVTIQRGAEKKKIAMTLVKLLP